MRPAALYSNTMNHGHSLHAPQSRSHTENWTGAGSLAILLSPVAVWLALSAPAFVLGVVLGVVGLKLGERLRWRRPPTRPKRPPTHRADSRPV